MNSHLLQIEDYQYAAKILNCTVAKIMAVAEVEAPKGGFIQKVDESGSVVVEPRILYEPFIFGRLTGHRFFDAEVKIRGIKYPLSLRGQWDAERAKYGRVVDQHIKLRAAVKYDRDAALMACSWGKFQILGKNYLAAGYNSLQGFINDMYRSEKEHLFAFCNFLKSTGLGEYLRKGDWTQFAEGYNGKLYWKHKYHTRLQLAETKYREYNESTDL